jgi:hypothetical protein
MRTAANAFPGNNRHMPDIHCPNCGYDLRLIPENRCPECGFGYDHAAIRRLAEEQHTLHRAANRWFIRQSVVALLIAAAPFIGQAPFNFLIKSIVYVFALVVALDIKGWLEEHDARHLIARTFKALIALPACAVAGVVFLEYPLPARLVCAIVLARAWYYLWRSPHRLPFLDRSLSEPVRQQGRRQGALATALLIAASCIAVLIWL